MQRRSPPDRHRRQTRVVQRPRSRAGGRRWPVHSLQFSEVCVVPLCYRGPTPMTQKEKRDIPVYGYPELVGREGLAIPCPILSPLGP